jgi:Flp pilus assembly protein TadB
MQPRLPAQRGLATAAVISGVVISLTVLLWVLDLITMPVFLGVVVVVCVAELAVFFVLLRRHAERARRSDEGAPAVRDPALDEVGYDPMERFRGPGS